MSNQIKPESFHPAQAASFQSEKEMMRGGAGMDCFDLSTHNIHVVSTENSVVSSSQNTATDLRAVKKLSSGASTVTSTSASTSSCGISNFADERKEDMDGSENFASAALQDVKPRTPAVLQMNAPPHPIAEFLFQLTKMLTDDNREFIEWRKATIFVHDPAGLEKNILPRYFRHSNYSSFQRQMNYFGFRKIAGKGKMAPCSYVNENVKEDISSLFFIKRKKTGVSSKAATVVAQHSVMNPIGGMNSFMMGGTGLVGGLNQPSLLSFNGLQGMGGRMNQMTPSHHFSNNTINEAALYREQQQMLAQLQHAHAAATKDLVLSGAPKVNSFGSGLCTTDQGNVYSASHNADWNTQYQTNNMGNANAQSLQLQQSTGLGTNCPQGNFRSFDSSANLRALLNQQISFFNNPNSSAPIPMSANQGFAKSTMMQDNELSAPSGTFNDQVGTDFLDNEALIRQLEQQLFEAQAMNGMGGLTGLSRGNGN